MKRTLLGIVLLVLACSSANATLHSRLSGQAFYDDVLNITWVADANLAVTSGFCPTCTVGLAPAAKASAFIDSLNSGLGFLGTTTWRLPSADVNANNTIIDCSNDTERNCRDNEMGYMFWQNKVKASSPSPFRNVQPGQYWSGTPDTFAGRSFIFDFSDGTQTPANINDAGFAWAVVSGDIVPPFPQLTPRLSINDISVRRPSVRGLTATTFFTVSLNCCTTGDTLVHYSTADGTATAPSDYMATADTLIIPRPLTISGGSTARISVTVNGSNTTKTRSFEMRLSKLVSPGGSYQIADQIGQATILPSSFLTGEFDLRTDSKRVHVGETVNYSLNWTVPDNEVWRSLETIDFRIREGNKTPLWVHWDEASDTFGVCDERGKQGFGINCTPTESPGSAVVLEGDSAQLLLADSSVVGSGPTGRSVTLNLAIRFLQKSPGHYRVELAASDDFGNEDPFVQASELQVDSRKAAVP